MPPLRYFLYVLGTVNAVMGGIFLGWALAAGGPPVEVVVPVILVASAVSAWVVLREFSAPA